MFSKYKKLDENSFILSMKHNKIWLNKQTNFSAVAENKNIFTDETEIYDYSKDKINIQNVTTMYQLAKIFNIKNLSNEAFNFIELCFTKVVETDNFFQLGYRSVARILASSSLHTTLEPFNAAERWLVFSVKERNKFAKYILSKVRLQSLSDNALKHLLGKSSLFFKTEQGIEIFKEILYTKEICISDRSIISCKNLLYSYKDKPNILVCGGYHLTSKTMTYERCNIVKNVNQTNGGNLQDVKVLPPMIEARALFEMVCLNGVVYAFDGCGGKWDVVNGRVCNIKSVEKYSPGADAWEKVANMYDYRNLFCVCAFENKVFIFGGNYPCINHPSPEVATSSCLQFDTNDYKWNQIAGMNQERRWAACANFNGRIVVSGGTDSNSNKLKTVEAYDVYADKWSSMPNMTKGRTNHKLVVAKNKLFVMATGAFEVLDDKCKVFIAFKAPEYLSMVWKAISIDGTIHVFQNDEPFVTCYDVDKGEWSKKSFDVTKNLNCYSCVKVPWFLESSN